jgi:Flp pilus assembly protein protease CpaA
MDLITLLLLWAAVLLAVGAYTDIRWREVPDWLNFAALAAGLGTRLIFTAVTGDWSIIIAGLLGFGIALVIAYAMFYLGQWGGGDSKMLLALGVLLGFQPSLSSYGVAFFINTLFVGAVYGILWSIGLAIANWRKFHNEFVKLQSMPHARWGIRGAFLLALILIAISFTLQVQLQLSLVVMALCVPLIVMLGIMIKSVENGCMIRRVPPTVLTEGDWVVKDVIVGGKRIAGPSDLGVSIPQIKKLVDLMRRHKLKTVLLKEGIPFVPSFFLAFVVMLLVGNLLLFLMP